MKKLRTTFRWIIWTLVSLYIVLIVLLHIPTIQTFVAHRVADAASTKLGTEVRIGRIDLGVLNRFILDDILIYDQNKKKMVSASRIGAKIDIMPLLRSGDINISSAQIFGLDANLYKKDKDAKPNFQFVLDSLASKDNSKKTPLHLAINSLVIRNGKIKYDILDAPQTPNKFNINHLLLSSISSHIIVNKLDNNSLWANLKSLSFNDASGISVKQLTFETKIDQHQGFINDFSLILPNSHVKLKQLSTHYQLENKKLINKSLKYSIKGFKADLTPSDFAPFTDDLRSLHTNYSTALEAKGTYDDVRIGLLSIKNEDLSTLLHAKGWVNNLHHRPNWKFSLNPITINNATLKTIAKLLHQAIPSTLNNLGDIYYKGSVSSIGGNLNAHGTLRSSAGEVRLTANVYGKHIRAKVNTSNFNLGRVLANPDFGMISTNIFVDGKTNLSYILAKGDIFSFEYKGYNYKNVHLNSLYKEDAFIGDLSINDPNGKLAIKGKAYNILAFIKKRERLSADIFINAQGVNLAALHLTNTLGNRTFSFKSQIKGSGSNINNIIGTLDVSQFMLNGDKENINLDHINVVMNNGLIAKSLKAKTDFGEIDINGQYNYQSLPQSIISVLGHYLPSIVNQHPNYHMVKDRNAYTFSLKLNNTQLINQLLKTSIISPYPIVASGAINEGRNEIKLSLDAADLTYAGQQLQNLSIDISTLSEGLLARLSGERKGTKGPHIIVNAEGLIKNNTISSDVNFQIPGHTALSGDINSIVEFTHHNGDLETQLHFNPSKINIDTITLNVLPSDLSYRRNNLNISHFEISNRNQHLIANGVTSGNMNDSITVKFKEIDVPYILDLANFHSVEFSGTASGTASIKSFFHQPKMEANLEVHNFKFEKGDMGTLYANVNYDKEGKIGIDAHADTDDGALTEIKGYGYIKNSYINLPIYAHNTHLSFLKTFCDSFMDKIKLRANGWCKVVGPLSDVNLEGDMEANGNVYIKPTGTTYDLMRGRIRIIPNEIIFANDTITDPYGHIGIVTGGLHHNSLRHLTYDINVEAQNLLAYNFPKHLGKESFWGIVYATGNCHIKGGPGTTTLDVEMKPCKNTFITYNAATTNDAGTNNFIHWLNTPKDSIESISSETNETQSVPTKMVSSPRHISKSGFANIPSDLHMNFILKTNPNLTLGVLMDEATGDNIKLNGSGIIRATYYNKGAFQLFGNYNVDYGQYNLTIQNIIKKQFIFQQGSTIAFGGDPFNAALDLKGVYTINSVPLSDLGLGNSFSSNNTKVNCLLDINGTPGAPSVNFGLDLPTLSSDAQQMVRSVLNSEQELNQQVLYLLAVGRFYPQSNNNSTAQGHRTPSGASLAMQSLLSGTLSQQINTVLSNVINTNNWNFGANIATGNEGFDNAEYEGTLSGSMLNNRLLFNGQFGYRDNVAKNNSSFIGDFDIRYLLSPNGNIAFRFYNQTNDRYFTRNSLTTQGIGLILKKDFNKLSDIWKKKKKKTKKRSQKL